MHCCFNRTDFYYSLLSPPLLHLCQTINCHSPVSLHGSLDLLDVVLHAHRAWPTRSLDILDTLDSTVELRYQTRTVSGVAVLSPNTWCKEFQQSMGVLPAFAKNLITEHCSIISSDIFEKCKQQNTNRNRENCNKLL